MQVLWVWVSSRCKDLQFRPEVASARLYLVVFPYSYSLDFGISGRSLAQRGAACLVPAQADDRLPGPKPQTPEPEALTKTNIHEA